MGSEQSEGFGTQAILFALEIAKVALAGLLIWLPLGVLAAIVVWALGGGPGKRGALISNAIAAGRDALMRFNRAVGGLVPGMLAKAREAMTNVSGARIILAERFQVTDKRIANVRRFITLAHAEFEKKVRRMRAGQQGVDQMLQRIDGTLEKVDVADIEFSESDGPRRSGAMLTGIVLTLLACFLITVNTMMLHEFFLGMFRVSTEVAWVLACVYTIVELSVGFVLKAINRSAPSVGRLSVQVFVILIILGAIAFETFLYGLSSDRADVLPEELVAQFPILRGWLGVMGFVLAGGIVLVGYYGGSAWLEVQERSGIQNFRRSVRRANTALRKLEGQIEHVRDRAAQARPATASAASVVIDDTREAAQIRAAVGEADDAFVKLRDSDVPLHAQEDERDGWGRLTFTLGMGGVGIATLLGAIFLLQPILLRSDLFSGAGPIGAPVFAVITVVMTMLAGYLLVPTLAVGRLAKLQEIDAEFRPTGPFASPTPVIAGTVFTAIMTLIAVVGSYSGGRLDMPSLTMSLALGAVSFGAGTQIVAVFHGLFLLVRLTIVSALHILATVLAWLLVGGSWLVWTIFWIIETFLYLIAVPVLWLFSKMFRPRQRAAAVAA